MMKTRLFKYFAMLLVLMMFCFSCLGCNTVEGMGEDIESGGEAIQDAAD